MARIAAADLSTRAFLHSRGIQVEPDTLDPMVAEAVARLHRTLYRSDPRTDLTAAEAAALEAGGFVIEPEIAPAEDRLATTAAEFAALLKTALTTGEAAKRLGLEPSAVRARLTSRPPCLYGIRLAGGWRLPSFQFTADGLVPGISQVLAAVDRDLHPVAVFRWFTTPNPDLTVEEEQEEEHSVSPLDWLRRGLPPDPPARIAAHL